MPAVPRTETLACQAEPGSFRDREGRIYYFDESVYRGISSAAYQNWQKLSASSFFKTACDTGKVIHTAEVDSSVLTQNMGQQWAAVLKHEKVPFISYPYEWSFSMLKDAALLQLELLNSALEDELILKDSSSFNIQWKGSNPVFIDIPSFEILQPNEPWIGYRQFCQLFLYPLMLQAYKNLPFQNWLRGNIDGISPSEINQLMSLKDYLKAGILTHVVLHSKLEATHADTESKLK
jgi:hypothetical protein